MINIVFLLMQISIIMLGAGSIYFVMYRLQKKHYFWCGFWTMMTIHSIITLAEMLFAS